MMKKLENEIEFDLKKKSCDVAEPARHSNVPMMKTRIVKHGRDGSSVIGTILGTAAVHNSQRRAADRGESMQTHPSNHFNRAIFLLIQL